ncbi:hypothetical protein [Microbacterium terricola]|nr:hypothetical protein [Microbacterium terricola]UYK40055.1 hypothetical protein OAU46_15420 [Microbacterium terricola]
MHTRQTPDTAHQDWWIRYDAVALVAHELGRLPRLSDGVLPAMVSWLANQRRNVGLTPEKRAALEALPGWSWDPRDDAWIARAEDLQLFIQERGRAPRIRSEGEERKLAYWHSQQRVALSDGRLRADRVAAFRYAIRGLRENPVK